MRPAIGTTRCWPTSWRVVSSGVATCGGRGSGAVRVVRSPPDPQPATTTSRTASTAPGARRRTSGPRPRAARAAARRAAARGGRRPRVGREASACSQASIASLRRSVRASAWARRDHAASLSGSRRTACSHALTSPPRSPRAGTRGRDRAARRGSARGAGRLQRVDRRSRSAEPQPQTADALPRVRVVGPTVHGAVGGLRREVDGAHVLVDAGCEAVRRRPVALDARPVADGAPGRGQVARLPERERHEPQDAVFSGSASRA